MSLADELTNIPAQPGGRQCHTGWLLTQLDPPDAQALTNALTRGATCTHIARTLAQNGWHIGVDSLRRHARTLRGEHGGCKCQTGEAS